MSVITQIDQSNYKTAQGLVVSRAHEIHKVYGLSYREAYNNALAEVAGMIGLEVDQFKSGLMTQVAAARKAKTNGNGRGNGRGNGHQASGNGASKPAMLPGFESPLVGSYVVPIVEAKIIDPPRPKLATLVLAELKRLKPKVGQRAALTMVDQDTALSAQKSVANVVKQLGWQGYKTERQGATLIITRL